MDISGTSTPTPCLLLAIGFRYGALGTEHDAKLG